MLQKIFSIVPDNISKAKVYAEASPNYLAVWSKNDLDEMEAFEWFQWELNAVIADECFEEAQQLSNLLNEPLNLYFNFPHTSIFPTDYWKEALSDNFISLQYGPSAGNIKFVQSDCSKNRVIVCRLSEKIIDSSGKYLKTVTVNAAWATIIHQIESNLTPSDTVLTLFFYPGSFNIILHIDGNLHFIGQEQYHHPESVLYSILNLLAQHNLSVADTKIAIAGMLESSSPLFKLLYQYLGKIEIESYNKIAQPVFFATIDAHILLPFAGYHI